MFKVIDGKRSRQDKRLLYLKAMGQKSKKISKESFLLYGVKYINLTENEFVERGLEDIRYMLSFTNILISIADRLTPSELLNVFPVDKDYRGEKYGTKDYFTTMAVLREHGMNKPLGDDAERVLFDYMNKDIFNFMIACRHLADRLSYMEGKEASLEGRSGKGFSIDAAGRRQEVYKKQPDYLKAL